MGKTWDDREGEEKENNEEAMQRFLIPHTPHPTPHTPHPTPDVKVKNLPL
ncbi:hypothetical protein [Moorena sp. SIO4G3]|nr:hypothetical protein [Moorena sp. SIO4G3]NEO81529.1 hypothetical protein [Moorena sp. SIO4G3]